MKRHFIQPEIMYNIYKGEIAFNKNQNKENTLPELAKLNSTIHSLELPILYGYSFVKSRPYGMALLLVPNWNMYGNIRLPKSLKDLDILV